MKIKALLIDFDGTLVNEDVLDYLCGVVGKGEESRMLNEQFHKGQIKGRTSLVKRINFLSGLSIQEIDGVLAQNDFLMPGAGNFFNYIRSKDIISILVSGNIIPVLEYYQKKLDINYVIGSHPRIKEGMIDSISEGDFPEKGLKAEGVKKILGKLGIGHDETVSIGDSPADKSIFGLSGKSIAINPKGGIEKKADYVIYNDLSKAIPIIEEIMQ